MKNYRNKIVYITGGSSGIGLSAAKLFAAQGAHVIIFARRKDVIKKALVEIEAAKSDRLQRFEGRSLDITDSKNVISVMKDAVRSFGVPDVLINCAGRAFPAYFEEITYEQFDDTMKVNLYGIWNCVAALFPSMKERGGYIVNVSSMAGFLGVFGYTDYSASKFGVIGFSEALKSEAKKYGITVSVLCPPDTDTPGFQTENLTKPEETRAVSAGAKLMSPDDVARELFKGMASKKFMIIPGFDGKLTFLVKRLFPALVEMIMDSSIRKVAKGEVVKKSTNN
ncbi:MAG TPA: SDR family oxidoreductase [Spirochaetota bacterium]|nr:SDR family oxidoreductase [Spirochaetota bacterium]HPI88197.1 SDR family oxidoreductase [Spirochaetota bacterium]HPR47258.1 SDR family oxidoreductase [Spirochaetota bacterium]